jgi:NDP-sugar pyrophosphorylase family protein
VPVSAILVVDNRSVIKPTCDELVPGDGDQASTGPVTPLEILGQSIVERTVNRLHSAGVKMVSVVNEAALSSTAGLRFIPDNLMKHAQKGFDKVLLIRVGAYAEVNLVEFLQFHREMGLAVTRACDAHGPLDFWVLDALPKKQYGLSLDSLSDGNMPAGYLTKGYVNRLTDARDFRRLVVDAFLGRCAIRPSGREIKPGVWVDKGARVHRTASIVAPVYIGQGVRIKASALVTRCSNVERKCLVDYGTAVEDSSILPFTYVGRALDVTDAVVDGQHMVNLSRNLAVTIEDPKIAGRTAYDWRRFRYAGQTVESMAPLGYGSVQLEPVAHTTAKQHPALPLLSKGQV